MFDFLSEEKKIFVWKEEKLKKLQIKFLYAKLDGQVKTICLNPSENETFETVKHRIKLKITNIKQSKKSKENNKNDFCTENFEIFLHGDLPKENATIKDIFYGYDSINIDEDEYKIVRDVPLLLKLNIFCKPYVGLPCIPSFDWKDDIQPIKKKCRWFVTKKLISNELIYKQMLEEFNLKDCQFLCESDWIYPNKEHLGYYLILCVEYSDMVLPSIFVSSSAINKIDENFIFDQRQKNFCAHKLPDSKCRIVSYNILADLYLNLKIDQKDCYFSYCPIVYQEAKYRYSIILRELEGYNADLICLQEVDLRMYLRFLLPFLEKQNFKLDYNCKGNLVNEGLCIAFCKKKFKLIKAFTHCQNTNPSVKKSIPVGMLISDLINIDNFPENIDIVELLKKNTTLYNFFITRPTIIQIILLESLVDSNVQLLVANTHLLSDPSFAHAKLLQTTLALRYILKIKKQIESQKKNLFILFCGDFNSKPDSSVAKLLQGNKITENSLCWNNSHGINIKEEIKFHSISNFPEYTNYTITNNKGFVGCIDFIWATPLPIVDKIVPLPSHSQVTQYGAIPSKIAPSDHLPLIVDVNFLNKNFV